MSRARLTTATVLALTARVSLDVDVAYYYHNIQWDQLIMMRDFDGDGDGEFGCGLLLACSRFLLFSVGSLDELSSHCRHRRCMHRATEHETRRDESEATSRERRDKKKRACVRACVRSLEAQASS